MNAPYFSIIVTVYNAERYLKEALDSIAEQSYREWECICVDDGSTDDSPRILDELAMRDSRFVVVHQKNGGVGRARNAGLDLAKGAWITWADADDVLASSRLAAAKRILDKERPDFLHLSFTMAKEMPTEFKNIGEDCSCWTCDDPVEIYECAYRNIYEFSMLWLCFARRELFDGVRYPIDMRVKGDSILYATLFPRIRRLCRGGHTGYFYRLTDGSILRSVRKASDCVRFQIESANIWEQQHVLAARLGEKALRAMEEELRRGAEDDLLDWLTTHGQVDEEVRQSVWVAYKKFCATGAGKASCRVAMRFRLGVAFYRATRKDCLVRFVDCMVRILRPIKKLFA